MQTPHLYYYHKKGLDPFRTVMDFPEAELVAFMETHLPEETIFHNDPTGYIRRRRETEAWLFTSFREIGGKPACPNPIYMTLGKSPYIERLGLYSECLEVPLSLFAPESLSFTYTDSYVSRWLAEAAHQCFNPLLHGRVFSLAEMLALLSDTPHVDARNSGNRRYNLFIEAQVWDHQPLRQFCAAAAKKPSP